MEKSIDLILTYSIKLLSVVVWLSSALFGLYILAFYALELLNGNLENWNDVLPGIYDKNAKAATGGIGLHFAAGGLILILGSLQFIEKIRTNMPVIHRWVGRLYIVSCLIAAIGGLVFIFAKGTIGGLVMDLGFALYGVLMFWAAIETFRKAKARQLDKHRAWAIRLYALAIGSWLYRMDYGFWKLTTDMAGHETNFTGSFDYFMDFFFYLPNLLVAEIIIRKHNNTISPFGKIASIILLLGVIAFFVLATDVFWDRYWGEPVLKLFGG